MVLVSLLGFEPEPENEPEKSTRKWIGWLVMLVAILVILGLGIATVGVEKWFDKPDCATTQTCHVPAPESSPAKVTQA